MKNVRSKICFNLSNPWMNQAFFLVMYACNGKKLNSEHQILIILRLDIIGVLGENTGEERYC